MMRFVLLFDEFLCLVSLIVAIFVIDVTFKTGVFTRLGVCGDLGVVCFGNVVDVLLLLCVFL